MQISVSGKNIDVGNSLKERMEHRLTEEIGKYLDRVTGATVVVGKEAHLFCVDVVLNTGTHSGIVIKARSEAGDVYSACDTAVDKIAKQLRRYKRKLTNHHRAKPAEMDGRAMRARKYVIAQEEEDVRDAPLVIAEKATDVEEMSVSEAVMRMDLSDLPALMFINTANGKPNVVYRRADGNISWIDPETVH